MYNQPEPDNPLVSVILPVYNGEEYLTGAINCVLDQGYQPIEVIVIDDGSTDSTAQIVQGFGDQVRYFFQFNSGPAAARNFGIGKAKGEFIAFIDADDLWPKNKLISQIKYFKSFPDIEIVQGLIRRTNKNDPNDPINYLFVCTNLGSMVIRKSVFEKIGLFDEDLVYHEDTDFWLKAREMGINILIQPKKSLHYRLHGKNMTTGKNMRTTGFLRILKRSLDRRRASSGNVRKIAKLKFVQDLINQKSTSAKTPRTRTKPLPLISVILYEASNSLNSRKALDSIINQNYHPTELIIIKAEKDVEFEQDYKDFVQTKIVAFDSQDFASQLNAGIEKSTGTFITFLDSNAEWTKGKLIKQIDYLLENPEHSFVGGRTRQILMPTQKYPVDLIDSFAFRKSLGDLLSTMMISQLAFEIVGGFTSGLAGLEETDWVLRAADKGLQKVILPDVFLFRFAQPDLEIQSSKLMEAALLKAVRRSVHRKRNSAHSNFEKE